MAQQHEAFEFGKNWSRFLREIDEDRIDQAIDSMRRLLGHDDLDGKRFLDAGSGSGLFSLSAHRLGAHVFSFDVDVDSVACAEALRDRFARESGCWNVEQGSLLDREFMNSLGEHEVVYCWGVAHHTGDMNSALEHLFRCVSPGGQLVLAIYNDQQYVSRIWAGVKRIYRKLPTPVRPIWVAGIGIVEFLKRLSVTLAASALRIFALRNPLTPFSNWIRESRGRGMHAWRDLVDWVGGWPFEVARPEIIFRMARDRGFQLQELVTVSGHGCNEFVFRRELASDESTTAAKGS